MYKIYHMIELLEDLNVFGKYFRARQDESDEIQARIYLLNMSFKIPLKLIYLVKKMQKYILVE